MLYSSGMQALREKIDRLNQEAYSSIYTDISLADSLMKEARELSAEANYTEGIAWTLLVSGLLEMEQSNLDQASGKLYQAHHIFIDINSDVRGTTASLNALGLICIRLSKMKEAFTHLQNALDSSRRHNLKDMEYRSMNLLGILQFHMENYNRALRFFKKALKLITNEKQCNILNNLGCCYRALGKYDIAMDHLHKALKEADKAGIKDSQIPILEEIGITFGKMNEHRQGIEMLEMALSRCNDFHNRFKLSINIKLAELYIKIEDYESAETSLNNARNYINYANSASNRDLYLYQSVLSEVKGNNKDALTHYKNYHMLSAKVKSTEIDEKVWELETESFRKMNRRIRAISEMGRRLTALLDREQVIGTLFQSIQSIFKVDCFSIGQKAEDRDELELQYYGGNGELIKAFASDMSQPANPETWVAVHRTGLIFNNMALDYHSYFSDLETPIPLMSMSSVLCLPFESGGSKGLITLYKEKESAFNREDYEILEMLTSYASIALSNARQTEIIKENNRELEKLNKFDGLTGIYNRRQLQSELERSWNLCRRAGQAFHIMLIDVDHFKKINDTLGHGAGDFCLKALGEQFRILLQRSSDIYGRYGGEEFLVILQDIPEAEAVDMAERIRHTVENSPVKWKNEVISMTVSIGLCSTTLSESNPVNQEAIIGNADKNMYISKSEGRNRLTTSSF